MRLAVLLFLLPLLAFAQGRPLYLDHTRLSEVGFEMEVRKFNQQVTIEMVLPEQSRNPQGLMDVFLMGDKLEIPVALSFDGKRESLTFSAPRDFLVKTDLVFKQPENAMVKEYRLSMAEVLGEKQSSGLDAAVAGRQQSGAERPVKRPPQPAPGRTVAKPDNAPQPPEAAGEQIRIAAMADLMLAVQSVETGEILYEQEVKRGRVVRINRQGPVNVYASRIENILVKANGETITAAQGATGEGALQIN